MRLVRAILGLFLLVVPVLGLTASSANAETIFSGACLVNATATYSTSIDVLASGTCQVNTWTITGGFHSTLHPLGPSSCAASFGSGNSDFDTSAPPSIAASPTDEYLAAAGTMTITFAYQVPRLVGVATLVAVPTELPACLTGASVVHYTGVVVFNDPS